MCNFTESTSSPGDICREGLRFKLPEGNMYHHQTPNVVSISSRVNPVATGVREGGRGVAVGKIWGSRSHMLAAKSKVGPRQNKKSRMPETGSKFH